MTPVALAAFLLLAGERPASTVPLCDARASLGISVLAVAVDPMETDRILAGVDRGTVYRSTSQVDCLSKSDAGLIAPSGLFPRPIYPYRLAIDPQDPHRVYVGTGEGLFGSVDGGATWRLILLPEVEIGEAPITSLAIDPVRPNIVYAGGWSSAYKSLDYGATWRPIDEGFITPTAPSPGTAAFDFDPRNTDTVYMAGWRLYKSLDGGGLWVKKDTGIFSESVWNVLVSQADPDVIYAGTSDGVYRSVNGASSWQPSGLLGRSVLSLAADPLDPSILFAGTDTGAYRSGDGGRRWTLVAGPFSDAAVHQLAVAPTDPATVYAATDVGVFRSRDGGASWSPLGIDRRTPRALRFIFS